LPIAYPIEGVSQISRSGSPATCFFFCSLECAALSAAGVAEFTHYALVVSLSFNKGLVIADVEHHVATPWGNLGSRGKPEGFGGISRS
jgi:hypothetical protein